MDCEVILRTKIEQLRQNQFWASENKGSRLLINSEDKEEFKEENTKRLIEFRNEILIRLDNAFSDLMTDELSSFDFKYFFTLDRLLKNILFFSRIAVLYFSQNLNQEYLVCDDMTKFNLEFYDAQLFHFMKIFTNLLNKPSPANQIEYERLFEAIYTHLRHITADFCLLPRKVISNVNFGCCFD